MVAAATVASKGERSMTLSLGFAIRPTNASSGSKFLSRPVLQLGRAIVPSASAGSTVGSRRA
jgi:hypothetical protein